jgi:hypothetical protein
LYAPASPVACGVRRRAAPWPSQWRWRGRERPLSAAEIASQFRQGRRVERDIALSLRAFARLGDLSTADAGKTFALRRAA